MLYFFLSGFFEQAGYPALPRDCVFTIVVEPESDTTLGHRIRVFLGLISVLVNL